MASGLGELFIELGTIGNVKDLEKFVAKVKEGATAIEKHMKANQEATKSSDNSIKGLINKIGKFKIAITATIFLINRMTNELTRTNQEFIQLTQQSNIALSTFNKWDSVGKMFGISNVAGQIENLNKRLFELRLTGQGARGFQLAGINPTGLDAEGVLERIRTRVQNMDNTQASYLLEQMGLDASLLKILKLGREEFENLWSTVKRYNLTDKERQDIEKLNIQLQICFIKFRYIKDKAIMALLPVWTKLMQSFARIGDVLISITEFAKKIFSIRIGVVTLGQAITGTLVPALMILLTVINPLLGLFTTLYLIADDFIAFLQGKDSVLGVFVNAIKDFQDKINFESPKWLKDLLALVQNITKLDDLGETLKNIKEGKENEVSLPKLGFTLNDLLTSVGYGSLLGRKGAELGNKLTNKNTTINMNNTIYTDSPAQTANDELLYLQYGTAMKD